MFTPRGIKWLKRTGRALAICLFACMAPVMLSDIAAAQGGDKNLAAQQGGMEGLLSRKTDPNDPRIAKPWQKWLGLGSFGVMIICVKYL